LHICTGRNFCLNMMKCLGDRLGCQIKIKQVFWTMSGPITTKSVVKGAAPFLDFLPWHVCILVVAQILALLCYSCEWMPQTASKFLPNYDQKAHLINGSLWHHRTSCSFCKKWLPWSTAHKLHFANALSLTRNSDINYSVFVLSASHAFSYTTLHVN